ncbi:unnamed protein product [Sympodiomycopsis kandeliae]
MTDELRPKANSVGVALLIVDVQYDFLEGGSLAVSNSNSILNNIKQLLKQHKVFDSIIASQDYHPRNHISFASNHDEEPFTEKQVQHPFTPNETVKQMLWPDHCIQGTRGCEIHSDILHDLKGVKKDGQTDVLIVRKGEDVNIDGYSALSDNAYTKFTPLIRYLSSLQRLEKSDKMKPPIEIVIVVGLALDYCVFSSAMDLLKFGLQVVIPLDCTKGVADKGCDQALHNLKSAGAFIVSTYQEALDLVERTTVSSVTPFMEGIRQSQQQIWDQV